MAALPPNILHVYIFSIKGNMTLTFIYLFQIRHRFGLFDEVSTSGGVQVRHCNWVRFLRVSEHYGPQVSIQYVEYIIL